MFLKRFFNFIPKNDYSRALDLFNEGYYVKALKVFEGLLEQDSSEEELDVATIELFACESHVALSKQQLVGRCHTAGVDLERALRCSDIESE